MNRGDVAVDAYVASFTTRRRPRAPATRGEKSEKPCPRIAVTSADLGMRRVVRMESPGEAGTSEWRRSTGGRGRRRGGIDDGRHTSTADAGPGATGVVCPTATTAVRPIPGLRRGRAAAEPPRPASRGDLPSPLRTDATRHRGARPRVRSRPRVVRRVQPPRRARPRNRTLGPVFFGVPLQSLSPFERGVD